MMWYVLIGLSLSLAGVAGLQFFYMIYLERMNREQKKRIYELERHTKYLSKRINEAERQITEQNEMLETFFDEVEEEEVWADVIEDR
jgi:16S rRNA C1402 (ribose-2'-O) methylase RsmI